MSHGVTRNQIEACRIRKQSFEQLENEKRNPQKDKISEGNSKFYI